MVNPLLGATASTLLWGTMFAAQTYVATGGKPSALDIGLSVLAFVPGISEAQEIGDQTEIEIQQVLVTEGTYTERGWRAITENGCVQTDLVDIQRGDIYESKRGYIQSFSRSYRTGLSQAQRQAALVGTRVDLWNDETGAVIPDFLVNSVSWTSKGPLPRVEISAMAYYALRDLGIGFSVVVD